MLHHMSRIVEERFEERGEIPMVWALESPQGIGVISARVVNTLSPEDGHAAKHMISKALQRGLIEWNVTRFVQATEVRVGEKQDGWVANDPDRHEAIDFRAHARGETLVAMRVIIRPPHGQPYLTR
jgi:hypothetical protein